MSTLKFKDPSPYTKPQPKPASEDYLYEKYLRDLSLKDDSRTDRVIGIALFGVGRAGTIHLSSILQNPRAKLLYIVDDAENNWDKWRRYWRLQNVKFLKSDQADAVFRDTSVDAVVVASPTYTHEGHVTRALKAGKAVFCEKPIAEERGNTAKYYEVAERTGKPLFCAFNRRFDPSYAAVRERVRRGDVGHAHVIKSTSRDSPLPALDYLRHSGGIFHDCLVHDLDIVTWVLGEYPNKISTQATANIPEIKGIDDHDTVIVSMTFPSGTLGVIDLSRNSNYGYDQRLEVFGPRGMVRADNEQPTHCLQTHSGLSGIVSPPIWYSFASRFRNGYLAEFEHFLDVVVGAASSSVKAKEVLAISKLASACEESARTGKAVELKWAEGELP